MQRKYTKLEAEIAKYKSGGVTATSNILLRTKNFAGLIMDILEAGGIQRPSSSSSLADASGTVKSIKGQVEHYKQRELIDNSETKEYDAHQDAPRKPMPPGPGPGPDPLREENATHRQTILDLKGENSALRQTVLDLKKGADQALRRVSVLEEERAALRDMVTQKEADIRRFEEGGAAGQGRSSSMRPK